MNQKLNKATRIPIQARRFINRILLSASWALEPRLIALLSLMVAIWAAVVANQSASIAAAEHDLNQKEHSSERMLVMRGTPTANGGGVTFSPIEDAIEIVDLRVAFPSGIEKGVARANGASNDVSLFPTKAALSSALAGPMSTPDGYGLYAPELALPIAVTTAYVARGETHLDNAVYFIKFSVVAPGNSPLQIDVSRAVFGFRSASFAAARQEAETMWSMALLDFGTSSARVRRERRITSSAQ